MTPSEASYEREPWMNYAACSGLEADVFFSSDEDAKAIARGICNTCPVVSQCLNYAITRGLNRDMDGMWGAHTPAQRRRVVRQRRLSARLQAH